MRENKKSNEKIKSYLILILVFVLIDMVLYTISLKSSMDNNTNQSQLNRTNVVNQYDTTEEMTEPTTETNAVIDEVTEPTEIENDTEVVEDGMNYDYSTGSSSWSQTSYLETYGLTNYDGNGLVIDRPATDILEVQHAFMYLVMHNVPSPVKIYGRGITQDIAAQINMDLDDTFASCVSYRLKNTSVSGVVCIEYGYELTDAFYVFMNITEGKPIPDGNTKASEMAAVVSTFIGNYINDSMSEYDKELAIHDYLCNNTTYGTAGTVIPDEHEAYGALVNHVAVCEGYSKAFVILSSCVGIETRMVIGSIDGQAHAWNLTCINGNWYHVDVTWDDPRYIDGDGYHDCGVSYQYFNLTDDTISSLRHSWDRNHYPICNSTECSVN